MLSTSSFSNQRNRMSKAPAKTRPTARGKAKKEIKEMKQKKNDELRTMLPRF